MMTIYCIISTITYLKYTWQGGTIFFSPLCPPNKLKQICPLDKLVVQLKTPWVVAVLIHHADCLPPWPAVSLNVIEKYLIKFINA